MLTLYYKPTCPFCQKVLSEAETLGVKLNLKDISSDEVIAQELIDKGGKQMVPYLVDEEKGVSMYESNDIVAHLTEHYANGEGGGSFNGLKVHKSDDTCDSCQ
ncbi:MAG: glutaredoxin 3 [Candidatus Azotimanducaceae bacterium]|jgi:glutaredoxin 3